MTKFDPTIAILGLGAIALFSFRKDVSKAVFEPVGQVTGAVGDIAQTGSNSIKEITSITEVVPVVSKEIQTIIIRESRESGERSLKRQEANLVELTGAVEEERIEARGEVDRKAINQQTLTSITQTGQDALIDIKQTFVSTFRPNPTQIEQRRASLKSGLSKIGSFLNPFD